MLLNNRNVPRDYLTNNSKPDYFISVVICRLHSRYENRRSSSVSSAPMQKNLVSSLDERKKRKKGKSAHCLPFDSRRRFSRVQRGEQIPRSAEWKPFALLSTGKLPPSRISLRFRDCKVRVIPPSKLRYTYPFERRPLLVQQSRTNLLPRFRDTFSTTR